MKRAVIVDYGIGNVDSVARAVEECGARALISASESDIAAATHLILPGVGAFGDGMRNLRERGLDAMLREQVLVGGIPFLGICLGMQLMATRGLEHGVTEGLGWIEGEVRRFTPTREDTRIPHIGWSEVEPARESALLAGITPGRDFYFVHSYHLACKDERDVLARTAYCDGFVSAVGRDRIFGVQFHPEKSQRAGFAVLRNFLAL